MGKFRYINLILVFSLIVSLFGVSQRNYIKIKLLEFIKPYTTEQSKKDGNSANENKEDIYQDVLALESTYEDYQKSLNTFFTTLDKQTGQNSSITKPFLEQEIGKITPKINNLHNINNQISKPEDKKLEFYSSLFEDTKNAISKKTLDLKDHQLTVENLENIVSTNQTKEFEQQINKINVELKLKIEETKTIILTKNILLKIEDKREGEQKHYLSILLLQSLILVMINIIVTLLLLRELFNKQDKSNKATSLSADIRTIKNQIYSQISEDFTSNDQFARKIDQLIQSFNNLQTRISNLEQTQNYYSQTPSSSRINRNYPSTPQTSLTKQITSLRSGNINFDEPAQPGIVQIYNLNAASLKSAAIQVLVTEESINETRGGSQQKKLLQRSRRGNYWIVDDSGKNYLVPENKFKLNTFNLSTIEYLFACNNYEASSSRNFHLIKPARVSVVTSNEVWQLEERGVLQFE